MQGGVTISEEESRRIGKVSWIVRRQEGEAGEAGSEAGDKREGRQGQEGEQVQGRERRVWGNA
jgi:hypothetical protein